MVTKSGTNAVHGEVLFLGRPGGVQEETLPSSGWCPESVSSCVPPTTGGAPTPLVPADVPDTLAQGSFAIGGPIKKGTTYFFVAGGYTNQDRTAPLTTPLGPAGEREGGVEGKR